MGFERDDSVKHSIIFVCISVLLISLSFSLLKTRIPGIVLSTCIISFVEVSRRRNSQQIYKIAFVDELTQLPNLDQMSKMIDSKIRNREAFILAVFDVKNFKLINDLWGYEMGDAYLCFVGDKLKEFADVFEFACRCENDVFAVIVKNSSIAVCEDIMETLFKEIGSLPDNENYHVQYSCGLVQQEGNYDSAYVMFDCAKIAKANAKKHQGKNIMVYDDYAKEEMIRRQQLKDDLQEALDNEEFVVYLQPKYNLRDDTLAGAEALIRWNYKHKEFLPPNQFVPVFEEDGSIGLIDQFVLKKVSEKFRQWMEEGYELLPISVNVSRVQLTNRNLVKNIADTVREQEVPFEYIDLELTESAAFDNMKYLLDTMGEIEQIGFRLSMDDFGTGYSSLGLLRKMPLNILKLDKSFVDGYVNEECEKERLMICDIINMAHHLGITVIAEGVETKVQRDMLRDAGCEIVQGFYYSKPIPIEEYEKLLRRVDMEAAACEEAMA
ncbi:MAG: bifunctional diguanylate cyclase/phosphodiesterase [Clostridium sp.]|nr:bifunctional diguanylate cyclase/phosphodiesterase [Clostridium sp.]